jgi:hypothetical protein
MRSYGETGELMRRLQAIYVDLSHFKWYADLYLFVGLR